MKPTRAAKKTRRAKRVAKKNTRWARGAARERARTDLWREIHIPGVTAGD